MTSTRTLQLFVIVSLVALVGCLEPTDSPPPTLVSDVSALSPSTHRLVQLRAHPDGTVSLTSITAVKQPLPRRRGVLAGRSSGWHYQALDADGAVLTDGDLVNPLVVRGAFVDPVTGEAETVQSERAEGASFTVRVPTHADAVRIFDSARDPDHKRASAHITLQVQP